MSIPSACKSFLAYLSLAIVALALCTSCSEAARKPESAKPSAASGHVANSSAVTNLAGKWLRPDGGYVLDIRSATEDGKLDAGYLNPRPINVSQATWRRSDELGLAVFVELRDKGYPGATYKLYYRAADDKLVGAYTQPAADQTFDVEFVRQK